MNNDESLVVASFTFQGDPALSQLSFPPGATIHVLSKHSPDWWYGSWNGQRGWFPPSHCRPTGREPPEHDGTTMARNDEDEPIIMGGAGKIHGAVRNFGTSPTFNPGLEDELAVPKREYDGYGNPFENHPQTDFEKAVQAKNAKKGKLFRGIKIGAPVLHVSAAKHKKENEVVRPAIRITPSPSGLARPAEAPHSPISGYRDSTAAAVTPRHPTLPTIPPTTREQMALEQRALMEQQTVLRQQEMLERQKQQIKKLELENQRYKTKWWKRGAINNAE